MRKANPFQTGDGFGNWMNDRCGKVTGSRIAATLAFIKQSEKEKKEGKPPEDKAERRNLKKEILLEWLTGDIVSKYVTYEMQWGIDQEPNAKSAFENRTGLLVSDCGFVPHPEIEGVGVSPDGICSDDYLVEFKCPTREKHLDWILGGVVPEEHKPQMTLQSACFGGKPVYFCSYDPRLPERYQLFIRKFEPTKEEINKIEQSAINFLAETETMFEQLTNGEV